MALEKLTKFLDENHVKYVAIRHSQAFTAQEVADSAHIPGKEMAKTVMVKLDGRMAMVVLPAPDKINTEDLRAGTGAHLVELAAEKEFAGLFPNCEVGAMPPFGNLWGLPVFVDGRLREDERIAFNAGSHTELIQLAWADFERLVRPTVMEFAEARD
jgi:Ala-tRNA(Pro) deacylase